MKVLFLGDIVGRSARQSVIAQLPDIRSELGLDAIIVVRECRRWLWRDPCHL